MTETQGLESLKYYLALYKAFFGPWFRPNGRDLQLPMEFPGGWFLQGCWMTDPTTVQELPGPGAEQGLRWAAQAAVAILPVLEEETGADRWGVRLVAGRLAVDMGFGLGSTCSKVPSASQCPRRSCLGDKDMCLLFGGSSPSPQRMGLKHLCSRALVKRGEGMPAPGRGRGTAGSGPRRRQLPAGVQRGRAGVGGAEKGVGIPRQAASPSSVL